MNKKALGKGLGALIPGHSTEKNAKKKDDEIFHIRLEEITSNPNQPRKDFCNEKISELAQSIKENGLIQPIIVRKKDFGFQIVAGERRYRACKYLGMEKIQAIIKNYDDKLTSRVALIENIQRQNLSSYEEAKAYQEILVEYDLTQAELAEVLGKSRSAVANILRLLDLPDEILEMLNQEFLFMGHARALLPVSDKKKMINLAKEIQKNGLSVRETEKKVKQLLTTKEIETKNKVQNVELNRLTNNLEAILGTKVNIKGTEKNGKIEISYYSLDELNRIIDMLETN